ncbi:MAG TPA: S41 family peptidase, partial [Blastocatellia bacterium]|nr:S41 family peptidase [Blastocatellia bacterium]
GGAASLRLVLESPGAQPRTVEVNAKVTGGRPMRDLRGFNSGNDRADLVREWEMEAEQHRHRYYEVGDDTLIWKMPAFDITEEQVGDMMEKVRKRKSLILDMRGNAGGYETTLLRMVGHLFDRDVKIGEIRGRKETKPLIAKSRGGRSFSGKLVVLVDSGSASSAEILARVVQLEKRGTVIGDRTSGSVMRARFEQYKSGIDLIFYYGVAVTIADFIMPDGKSLEGAGVTPDELLLPKATDLAAGRDIALARAAQLVGLDLEPEKAGAMFPVEWRK